MNVNNKVSLTDDQRKQIANSLGQTAMLSRADVNALVSGLFEGLMDSAPLKEPERKKGAKKIDRPKPKVVKSTALQEEWVAKRLKDKTITPSQVYGYRVGWNKESM